MMSYCQTKHVIDITLCFSWMKLYHPVETSVTSMAVACETSEEDHPQNYISGYKLE